MKAARKPYGPLMQTNVNALTQARATLAPEDDEDEEKVNNNDFLFESIIVRLSWLVWRVFESFASEHVNNNRCAIELVVDCRLTAIRLTAAFVG